MRVTCDVPVRAEDFTAVVWSTDNEDLGTFETSNEMINRLYENTRWSQRSNMVSIPTDCPQRGKGGMDRRYSDLRPNLPAQRKYHAVSGRDGCRISPATSIKTERFRWLFPLLVCIGCWRKSTRFTCGNRGPVGAAGWGDAACMVPWSMYEITGNRRILREQYDSMKAWCDYIIATAETRKGRTNCRGRSTDICGIQVFSTANG